jgi:hypothetical protein
MNLGKLIERLEILAVNNPDASVYFEFCGVFPLLKFASSRCYYERLAVEWFPERYEVDGEPINAPTVAKFTAALKAQIGRKIHGYKGGEYIVSKAFPLHVDKYGECTSTVVYGVREEGYRVVLETENE